MVEAKTLRAALIELPFLQEFGAADERAFAIDVTLRTFTSQPCLLNDRVEDKDGPGERARVTKARFNAMYEDGL